MRNDELYNPAPQSAQLELWGLGSDGEQPHIQIAIDYYTEERNEWKRK